MRTMLVAIKRVWLFLHLVTPRRFNKTLNLTPKAKRYRTTHRIFTKTRRQTKSKDPICSRFFWKNPYLQDRCSNQCNV
ncbi:unnamed protein product [Larinioides sclopetarius]|uniref:Secreted protein n=1 Tax=Larinioides sclopetarius TaxID=280406 RepID=A0AAV2BNP1_9ARAC